MTASMFLLPSTRLVTFSTVVQINKMAREAVHHRWLWRICVQLFHRNAHLKTTAIHNSKVHLSKSQQGLLHHFTIRSKTMISLKSTSVAFVLSLARHVRLELRQRDHHRDRHLQVMYQEARRHWQDSHEDHHHHKGHQFLYPRIKCIERHHSMQGAQGRYR